MSSPKEETNIGLQRRAVAPQEQKIWTAGTLKYTKSGLFILFFWLMWNDFFLMLMEAVKPALTGILMKDYGATNTEIALYLSTLPAICTCWINPVFSTWSDRTRTRWGRRRPFLLLSTLPAAFFLGVIPFAPKIWAWLMSMHWFASIFAGNLFNGAVLAIGVCSIFYAIFNSVLTAIFSYYYWDVVPESVLGRFNGVAKIVTNIKTFIWNYWIFGMAETHMEWIYVCLATSFAVIYLVSLYMVPEGEYPPPPPPSKTSSIKLVEPVRSYFVECFSKPYYLWFFGAHAIYQIGNLTNIYQIFYFNHDLGLSLDTVGKLRSWPLLGVVILAYPIGKLIDYLKPVRMISPVLFIWGASNLIAFFFLRDKWSFFFCLTLLTFANFPFGICLNAMTVEIFPREKLGQFCSANQITSVTLNFFVSIGVGYLFDLIKNYRYVFLWSATFQILAALAFLKVYRNWRKVQGRPPLFASQVASGTES